MTAQEVALVRVQLGRLDEADGEVVGEVFPDVPATGETGWIGYSAPRHSA